MGTGRVIRFCFQVNEKEPRSLHQLRDGNAFGEFYPVLNNAGFTYGGIIVNQSSSDQPARQSQRGMPGTDDLVVMCTRPPLDDKWQDGRPKMCLSGSLLEEKVLAGLRCCFEVCSRSHVVLSENLAAMLREGYENRADIQFYCNKYATYLRCSRYHHSRKDRFKTPRTACYLMILPPHDKEHGCVSMFSISGNYTLCFAYLLRTKLWRQLACDLSKPRFVMVELQPIPQPSNPLTLNFVDEWEYDVVLDTNDDPSYQPMTALPPPARRNARR